MKAKLLLTSVIGLGCVLLGRTGPRPVFPDLGTACPGRDPKNNPRFVVTNFSDEPEAAYQFYCGRGDVENRLKELHHGLEMDRTSCERFLANQFRVLLTLAAYVLFRKCLHRPCI